MKYFPFTCAFAVVNICAAPCLAQTKTATDKPTPRVAEDSVSKTPSAFAEYKKRDPNEPMKNWREANDRVEALAGHMGHVRGTPKPKPPSAPKANVTNEKKP